MEFTKALVLAGPTRHDRPWPSVTSGPKHLVSLANRPILLHSLESLRRAKVCDVTLAVDRDSATPIMNVVGDGSACGLRVRYVRWRPSTGVAGALAAARTFVADDSILVEPADALHGEQLGRHIAAFTEERLDAMVLRLSGAPCDEHGEPVDGGYLLSRRAVSILVDGRRFIGDPVSGIAGAGGNVRIQGMEGSLPCHGAQDQLLEGNRRMLEEIEPNVDPAAFPTCEFQGVVRVHPSARLDHTLIRGPVTIGPESVLSHAYVGPYTSVGARVRIEGSQIEHSVVLDGAELLHVGARLETSVIGREARLSRSFQMPTAMRVAIGDGAQVTLS